MTEQEQFIQAIKSKFGDLVDLRICRNGNGEFMTWDAQVAFWAWQAAQQKEGYVLVPVELPYQIFNAISDGICDDTPTEQIWADILKAAQEME